MNRNMFMDSYRKLSAESVVEAEIESNENFWDFFDNHHPLFVYFFFLSFLPAGERALSLHQVRAQVNKTKTKLSQFFIIS